MLLNQVILVGKVVGVKGTVLELEYEEGKVIKVSSDMFKLDEIKPGSLIGIKGKLVQENSKMSVEVERITRIKEN
jgi:uncharacterized protein YdeI (BOF family)